MKKLLFIFGLLVALAGGMLFSRTSVQSVHADPTALKVIICHWDNGQGGKYTQNDININSINDCIGAAGHDGHSSDIIPSYTYGNCVYLGKNLSKVSWIANNCTQPITPTPSVTPSVTPSITPTVTPSITPSPTPSVTPTVTPSITPKPTQTPTHFACVEDACEQVSGSGDNECSSNEDCGEEEPLHHFTCNPDLHTCIQVAGPGQSSCLTNNDCQPHHFACVNSACAVINTAGTDSCKTDTDCTPAPTITPTPTQTPSNPGGPGDGRSDGRSDGGSSCPSCTSAPHTQVLGASTGPTQAVLGASTMAGTGTFENTLMEVMMIAGTIVLGTGLKSYAKEKKN